MHKYIERIVNVKGDGNCGFQVVYALLSKGEVNHTLVCHQLIYELRTHKESYTQFYGKKEIFDAIHSFLFLALVD